MVRKRVLRIVLLSIIGIAVAAGVGIAYRALMAKWRDDVREPLIAAFFFGVLYFVCCMVGLRLAERREQMARPPGE